VKVKRTIYMVVYLVCTVGCTICWFADMVAGEGKGWGQDTSVLREHTPLIPWPLTCILDYGTLVCVALTTKFLPNNPVLVAHYIKVDRLESANMVRGLYMRSPNGWKDVRSMSTVAAAPTEMPRAVLGPVDENATAELLNSAELFNSDRLSDRSIEPDQSRVSRVSGDL
jgi:hypothetical protein